MSGKIGNDKIFIVDENNNKDFRDDSVRPYQKMDWFTTRRLIKCKYKIFNGTELVKDSSWINIGKSDNGDLSTVITHHLESSFSLDNQSYQVGIVSSQSNFGFDNIVDKPILALMSQNGVKKDTLLESELIKKGEYLKLGNGYYRFDHVTNDGEYITLVKEKDFNSKIGTQVGMISPDFTCRSMDGDSISLKNYTGKYLLLVNVSACWSRISSYKCYKDLAESCNGKFEYLCIDNSPNFLRQNIKDLNLTGKFIIAGENKLIKKYFRPDFCSRTCFLIDPKGRLIDKFEIFSWKSHLAGILKKK
jgi:peroxiredoxin